jgi:glycosyltransferase involved in cell wall biosynthesis
LRVLAVSHSYPRFDGDLAGVFLERLYVALTARGHAVRVIAPADEGRGGVEERRGIVVERVRYAAPVRETLAYRGTMTQAVRGPGGALAFRGLVRALGGAVRDRSADTDVIHANWWVPAGLAVRRRREERSPPYVVTLHGTDAMLLWRSRVARWIARPVLREAAAVTAVSGFLAGIAERAGAQPRPVVLPMPTEIGLPSVASPGGQGLITIGRLTRQKRVHLVVETVAQLHARGRAVALTVVGDGPERPSLESLVQRRGLKAYVRFTGAVAPEDIAPVLAGADVFVFPAKHEGFGLAAAEALIAGVPIVVAADGGGVLDVARPEAGAAVVSAGDPSALATAVERLLAAGDEARAAAAAVGVEWRERLGPSSVAERLERVLERACGA